MMASVFHSDTIRELKHEDGDVLAMRLQYLGEGVFQQTGIQEVFVECPRVASVTGMARPALDGDVSVRRTA
jgi:hypothetical protein